MKVQVAGLSSQPHGRSFDSGIRGQEIAAYEDMHAWLVPVAGQTKRQDHCNLKACMKCSMQRFGEVLAFKVIKVDRQVRLLHQSQVRLLKVLRCSRHLYPSIVRCSTQNPPKPPKSNWVPTLLFFSLRNCVSWEGELTAHLVSRLLFWSQVDRFEKRSFSSAYGAHYFTISQQASSNLRSSKRYLCLLKTDHIIVAQVWLCLRGNEVGQQDNIRNLWKALTDNKSSKPTEINKGTNDLWELSRNILLFLGRIEQSSQYSLTLIFHRRAWVLAKPQTFCSSTSSFMV